MKNLKIFALLGALVLFTGKTVAYTTNNAAGAILSNGIEDTTLPVSVPGGLYAAFTNDGGATNNAILIAGTNYITNTGAHDLTVIAIDNTTNTASAGTPTAFYSFIFTNYGNTNTTVSMEVRSNSVGGFTPGYITEIYTNGVLAVSGTGPQTFSDDVARDTRVSNAIRFIIPAGSPNGEQADFQMKLVNSVGLIATGGGDGWPTWNATNFYAAARVNTNTVGFSTNGGVGPRDSQITFPSVIVQGPVILVSKSVLTTGPYRPFDIVTFKITFTNAGGADARDFEIRDLIPAEFLLLTNSLKGGLTTDTYASAAQTYNPAAEVSDDVEVAGALEDLLIFEVGANGVKVPVDGNHIILPGQAGAVFFQVLVK